MQSIRVAIAGIGNCANALVQGLWYYKDAGDLKLVGLMRPDIGGIRPADIRVVAAFDVDRRKVGRPLEEAIFAPPNCAYGFADDLPQSGVKVAMGPVLDGVPAHMAQYPDEDAFRVADAAPVDVAAALGESGAQVLVCYLPVGAERAVRHYANACLQSSVALVNCQPVFIASDPEWAERFRLAGLPIIGDDIKSQIGATIVHRNLVKLFADRGVQLERTYQLNTGGNTDFLNMLDRSRLASKRHSKTQAVLSQLATPLAERNIHVSPSDYVRWLGDNKVCFIRLEGRGFGHTTVEIELRMSVNDSPNSAAPVIDAIRCVKLALDQNVAGPLEAVSAWYMKHPPVQMTDADARDGTEAFICTSAKL